MVKILLLNDNTEHPNWGAQATPFALKKMFRDRIPEVEIETLSWSWIRTQIRIPRIPFLNRWHITRNDIPFTRMLVNKMTTGLQIYPAIRDDFDWFAEQWTAGKMGPVANGFVELARWADVVVYNGENSIYRNTVEGCRSIFLLYLARTQLNTPACAVNQTVHVTQVRPIMKAMIQSVYPMLDVVSNREPKSWQRLRDLGVHSARLSADAVFYLNDLDHMNEKVRLWQRQNNLERGAYFCLSASGLPASRPRPNWDGEMAHLVRGLDTLGLRAVLVARDPHCQFLKEVARRTGAVFFGPEHEFPELWPLFRDAGLLITGHFHYAIIASMVGCPFVPLSVNNHKMAGLCEHLDWPFQDPFDITFLAKEKDAILAASHQLLQDREALSNHLRRRSAELRELAGATADWVREAATANKGDGTARERSA